MESEQNWIDEKSFRVEGDEEFSRDKVWDGEPDQEIIKDMIEYTWLYKQPFYKRLYGDKLL
mgnify:CR=1 FL=1